MSSVTLAAVAQSASTAQTVRVTEVSYGIRFSAKPRAGTVKFQVRNASDDAHDFWLKGGGKTWKTRVLGGSRTASLTAKLKKGVRYSFWCSVGPPPGRDERQLRRPLTSVTAPAPSGAVRAGTLQPMAHQKRTILLVEDEESITTPLAEALERDGFHAEIAHTVADALGRGRALRPDLVLLDLVLPDGSGLDVCRELRASSNVPIIILSARGEEADRVVGLELGADDYVVKPFSAREVIARIRAVLRRASARGAAADGPIEIGAVRLDPSRRARVTLDGEPLELARKEFDLLALLMREAGTVVSRERLIDEVWDVNWFGSTKTLDVHVSALRKKLDDDAAARPATSTPCAASGSASRRPRSCDEPPAAPARRVRLRARARAGRARDPARAQPLRAASTTR